VRRPVDTIRPTWTAQACVWTNLALCAIPQSMNSTHGSEDRSFLWVARCEGISELVRPYGRSLLRVPVLADLKDSGDGRPCKGGAVGGVGPHACSEEVQEVGGLTSGVEV
jgi:hypothetical protein